MVTHAAVSEHEVRMEIRGSLQGEIAATFQTELETLLASAYRTITLDLTDVGSISSSSIGRILLSRKKLAEQGRNIRIEGCSDTLLGTLRLIRFDRLVPIRR